MEGPNKRLKLQVSQTACDLCPQSGFVDNPATDICQTGSGSLDADIMVVTKMPDTEKYRKLLVEELRANGIDPKRVLFTGATKCQTWDRNPTRKDVKVCADNFLTAEVEIVDPDYILALGNEALQATVGKSGITKYRGKVFKDTGWFADPQVFPTVSPAMVLRNPRYLKGWKADISFFASLCRGENLEETEVKYHTVDTKDQLKKLVRYLKAAQVVSYDVETTRFEEFMGDSAIVSLSLTLMGPRYNRPATFVIPLYHPQSVWRKSWRRILKVIAPFVSAVPKQIAHNGKFDDRWMRQFGIDTTCTFDTMLAAHVIDENRSKGLKNLGRTLLGVPAWDMDTKNLLGEPIEDVLHYNAHDTYYTYLLYLRLRQQLIDDKRKARLFMKIMMPASADLTAAERHGIWCDRERLATNTKIAYDTLYDIERQLMQWVPEDIPDHIPTNKRTGSQINFNASNFARWWLFEYLELPVLSRGKKKDNGDPGNPSMAEDVLLELRGDHPAVDTMLERVKWQKYTSSFFDPYNEQIGEDDRIHTTYKLHGTVTGRLSSGKEDEEKVTAKVQRRGVNLQQVPRDTFVRSIFGAPPGWTFVEADFSQIELRVVAFLSRDRNMLHLYKTGQDIHTATASWVLGIPLSQITKDERKKAKAVNFGFVYGMGAAKFVHTAFTKYDLRFTEEEAQEIRKSFFSQFAGLQPWHAKQRKLAHKYKRVQSPIGRVRHLPDIDSSDRGVVGEAERQAINSPVQSFASDLTQLSMIHINQKFRKQGINGFVIGTVHDSLLFEIEDQELSRAMPLIKDTMQNLPLEKEFGIHIDVPIIADIGVGKNWGETRELKPEEVYSWAS